MCKVHIMSATWPCLSSHSQDTGSGRKCKLFHGNDLFNESGLLKCLMFMYTVVYFFLPTSCGAAAFPTLTHPGCSYTFSLLVSSPVPSLSCLSRYLFIFIRVSDLSQTYIPLDFASTVGHREKHCKSKVPFLSQCLF